MNELLLHHTGMHVKQTALTSWLFRKKRKLIWCPATQTTCQHCFITCTSNVYICFTSIVTNSTTKLCRGERMEKLQAETFSLLSISSSKLLNLERAPYRQRASHNMPCLFLFLLSPSTDTCDLGSPHSSHNFLALSSRCATSIRGVIILPE